MDTMEALLTRRSIRKYTSKPVSPELVTELLRAAMSAPSAVNEKPWHFIVVTDRAVLNEVPRFHAFSAMLKTAPVAIAVCGELALQRKFEGFWVQDCAAATENLLLAAHANGLGAVWLGFYPIAERVEALQKLLGLPEGVIPLSMVALGYPDEEKDAPDRYDATRVHANRW